MNSAATQYLLLVYLVINYYIHYYIGIYGKNGKTLLTCTVFSHYYIVYRKNTVDLQNVFSTWFIL